MSFVAAAIGAVVTVGATAISANQQKQARKGASQKAASLQRDIELLEQERNRTIPIIDPYAGVNDLSFMIENFSEEFSNPFANLGVATQAAEIQMQQTDQALANTLDLLASTGASAGGATALAQAAAASKKNVAATIEKQEASNEIMRAKGQSQLEANKISEEVRVQAGLMNEAQRQQQVDVQSEIFQFREKDKRMMEQLDRKQAQITGQQQRAQTASNNEASIISQGISSTANIVSSGIEAAGSKSAEQGTYSGSAQDQDFSRYINAQPPKL